MPRRVVDDDMRRYYDRRAHEYDDWWLGTGLFAARERPGWSEEVERLVSAIRGLQPARTLDVACGELVCALDAGLQGHVAGRASRASRGSRSELAQANAITPSTPRASGAPALTVLSSSKPGSWMMR